MVLLLGTPAEADSDASGRRGVQTLRVTVKNLTLAVGVLDGARADLDAALVHAVRLELETGRLVSPELSQEMKTILGDPAIHHKFVKGLEKNRPGSRIYRKSGSWRQYHADSAIVERDGHRYIAVALAQNPAGGRWLSNLIVAMDTLICHPEVPPQQLAYLGN